MVGASLRDSEYRLPGVVPNAEEIIPEPGNPERSDTANQRCGFAGDVGCHERGIFGMLGSIYGRKTCQDTSDCQKGRRCGCNPNAS